MTKTPHTAWNNCLKIIKKHLPTQSIRTWFLPIVPLKLEGSSLTVQVPSQFFYEWIEEHYLSTLRKAVHETLGKDGKLSYSIPIDKGNKQHPPTHMQLPQQPYASSKDTLLSQSSYFKKEREGSLQEQLNAMMGRLHKKYVFDNFVGGGSNLMIQQAGISVAEQPGRTVFNPLLIYGKVGLGKTHLIQAMAHHMAEKQPGLRVMYLSGEQFLSQFILSLRHKQMQAFCDLYLSADALLIDDIQSLREKERTQELFFHIFNHLHQGGKQLVFTCDTPPTALPGMQERLISRFKWGLTLEIQMPSYDIRREILNKRAAQEGIQLPAEILDYLAQHIDTNVRELEGALVSTLAHAMLAKKHVDLPLVQETVARIVEKKPVALSIEHIQRTVSGYFRVPEADILAKTRRREVVIARQVAMYLVKNYTSHSLSSIGTHFGKRDHSTVIHALQSIGQLQNKNEKVKQALQTLGTQLQAAS